MSRILMPIGDMMLQHSTIEFAACIAKKANSPITLMPLKTGDRKELKLSESVSRSSGIGAAQTKFGNRTTMEDRYQLQLANSCKQSFGNYSTETISGADEPTSLQTLLLETRFADLVIVEGNLSPKSSLLETNPTHYVKEILHNTECPVLIAPLSFHPPEDILFAYDGSSSSMFAIRQFVQLFPDMTRNKLYILEIYQDNVRGKEKEMLAKWLSNHFAQVEFIILSGNADSRLLEYAMTMHQSIIVMGGYGRNIWSRLLQPSTTSAIVKIISSPVFIAHK